MFAKKVISVFLAMMMVMMGCSLHISALAGEDVDIDVSELMLSEYAEYNEEFYLKNIWEGDTVYHESALFVTGRDTVKLLYPVDEVISLRSYDLKTNYIEGADYEVTADGAIKILPGSKIPVYTGALTTETKPAQNAFPLKDGSGYLSFIGDTTYPRYAISVTYRHSKTYADGYTPAAPVSQNKKLKDTIAKLEAGETVNIAIYGDSISCGWSSSGLNNTNGIYDRTNTEGNFERYVINVAPYAPTWIDMFLSAMQKRYRNATINLKNLSLAGTSSAWGAKNIAARLALWKDAEGNQVTPDLLLVGFGVNDVAGNVTASAFKSNSQSIIDTARTASGNSDMEVLLYSPMLPNQSATTWDQTKLLIYENALAEIAATDENIGLLQLTSIFTEIVKSKEAVDYLNTNVNHGNDFTARIYATGILAMFGDAPSAETPVLAEKTSSSVTLTAVDGYEYSKDGTNWQSSNVFIGLTPKTEYTFYQRFAETDATYAGAASAGLQVTTDEPAAFLPGDIDNDGTVGLKDVVALAQVKAGWDIEYVEAALDPNGDGEFDLDDVVYLAQHVAEWEDRALSTVPYVPYYKTLTSVVKKQGSWTLKFLNGQELYSVDMILCQPGENFAGVGIGDLLSTLPSDMQNDPNITDYCELFNGEYYYIGRGDGDDIQTVAEEKDTVTLTDSSGNNLVLTRTGEDTLKCASAPASFARIAGIPVGAVFTFVAG